MSKYILIALILALTLLLTSCQVKQPVEVITTAAITVTARPTNLPTYTPQSVITPTLIPSLEVSTTPADLATTPTRTPTCFVSTYFPIVFLPDNIRMLMRSDSGVQIFNLETLKEEGFIPAPKRLNGAINVSPNGNILAWAFEDHTIQLVRLSDQEVINTLSGHTDIITKLKFSPGGDRLFSASHDTWVRIWDNAGNQVGSFQPTGANDFPSDVLGMGISPDGKMLANIPFDGPVKIWSLVDYTLIRELGGSGGYDTSDVVFSPDGQFIAADLATGLFLWRVSDGAQLLGGNPGINSMAVAFSPDGNYLAYAEIGETYHIVLSSPDGTQKLHVLEGLQAPVWELMFSPDSSLLISTGTELRIWRVEDFQLMYIGKSACP